MEKKKIRVFGNTFYLLGKGKDGDMYYLQEPSWDCGWYWGLGYVETFTNKKQPERSRDISMHTHFDSLFLKGPKHAYDMFKSFFSDTVLTEDEIWKLVDYMNTCYKLRETAAIVGRGYSHMTERAKLEEVKDDTLKRRINEEMIPAINTQVTILLSPTL